MQCQIWKELHNSKENTNINSSGINSHGKLKNISKQKEGGNGLLKEDLMCSDL